MTRPHRQRRTGFTLVEAVIGCLLVAIVLVPALQLIGDSSRSRVTQLETNRGMWLARELMSEVLQARYADPDVTTGEDRSTWDDVSDYHNLTETPPAQRDGTAIAGFAGWTRQVRVRYADPANPANASGADTGLKQVVVTVTSDTGRTFTLAALKSAFDASERRPASTESAVTSIDIRLDMGTGKPLTTSVNTQNQLP